MRKSIATVALSGKLRDKLDAIATSGFDGVEIFEPNLRSFDGTPTEVGRYAEDLGLKIELFQPLRDFEGVSDWELRQNLGRAEAAFDTMGELGAPLLLACSNASATALDGEERAAAQLHELAERAAKRGLRVGYEALAWGKHVNRFDQAFQIVQRANHPNLGLILDSFHTLVRPEDWSSLADIPGNRISFVQLGDAPRVNVDALTLRRNYSRLPGQGDFDVAGFLRAVLSTGYCGTVSIEIFNEQTPDSPLETADAGMRSLQVIEERAGQRA